MPEVVCGGGIHSIGDHYMVLIMGTVIRGCWVRVIRIMSQWIIDAIVRYILLINSVNRSIGAFFAVKFEVELERPSNAMDGVLKERLPQRCAFCHHQLGLVISL